MLEGSMTIPLPSRFRGISIKLSIYPKGMFKGGLLSGKTALDKSDLLISGGEAGPQIPLTSELNDRKSWCLNNSYRYR